MKMYDLLKELSVELANKFNIDQNSVLSIIQYKLFPYEKKPKDNFISNQKIE